MSWVTDLRQGYDIVDFAGHIVTKTPNSMKELDEIIGPVHKDPELVRERYRDAGIDKVVLSQPPFIGHSDAAAAAEANDELLNVIDDYNEFYGLAALPVGAGGRAAADELERCLEHGYHGGAIETKSKGITLTDEDMAPIFDIAEKSGAPLFVHPKLNNSLHPHVLDDTYRLNAIFGREVALSESICRLIHCNTFEKYPELNLVFHHLGGNIASMLGRINLHLDTGRWPGQDQVKSFSEFRWVLENRIYFDTSGFFGYHPPLEAALQELPVSQIVFGTDAPYEGRTAAELNRFTSVINDITSEADAETIFTNANRLLANK